MRKVRLYLNSDKRDAAAKGAALAARLETYGLVETSESQADIIIALGGDGTILKAVREFPGLPVLGLNLGGLGYLSSVGYDAAESALEMLSAGRYTIAERTLVEAIGPDGGRSLALNDIVVTREHSGHSVRLDLAADGKLVTRYMADGLIFATPTGSTAYSLAAGGPVVLPDSPNLVVTPLTPHALGVRPFVVRDDVRFRVTVQPRTDGNNVSVGVYADGSQVMSLAVGESLQIVRSTERARLVALEDYNPFDVLARKLGWSGSNVR